jgi:hypothetical protein
MKMRDLQKKACARGDNCGARSNYSLDASGISIAFIENLSLAQMFPAASIRAFGGFAFKWR